MHASQTCYSHKKNIDKQTMHKHGKECLSNCETYSCWSTQWDQELHIFGSREKKTEGMHRYQEHAKCWCSENWMHACIYKIKTQAHKIGVFYITWI